MLLNAKFRYKSLTDLDSKKLLLLELFLVEIQLDPGLAKHITNKCWERLIDHLFNATCKGMTVSTIKMSYIYKIIVWAFHLKSEKLLINLVCSQNLLAPLAGVLTAKEGIEIYEQEVSTYLAFSKLPVKKRYVQLYIASNLLVKWAHRIFKLHFSSIRSHWKIK